MAADAIAVRADYADALLAARRAKNWLVAILLIVLLGELAIFFTARYTALITPHVVSATTQPSTKSPLEVLRYLVGVFDIAGLVASIILSLVLLLIVNTMLVCRLVGVGKLTSAFIWTIVLIVLVFPWQALLSNPAITGTTSTGDFKVPGILYTWAELKHESMGAKFPTDQPAVAILRWARYVGFPVIAVIILLVVHFRSTKGLRTAMSGEAAPTLVDQSINATPPSIT